MVTIRNLKAKKGVDKPGQGTIYVIAGKEYELYSEFLTEKMYSGKCYVILCEDGKFHGIDSDYFEDL